ncbi:MAG: Zn-ribbon domain-containing OB-fold protein [Candidatus Brocadiia bacterium]
MFEKKLSNNGVKRWSGKMEVSYIYTTGVAGQRFFKELKEKESILGTECKKCKLVYLPPRLYCERCFSRLDTWKKAPSKGTIYSYAVTHVDLNGEPANRPVITALINFKGFHGGLVHKIEEIAPDEVKIGMVVKPVFEEKAKRQGGITDIKYFAPV